MILMSSLSEILNKASRTVDCGDGRETQRLDCTGLRREVVWALLSHVKAREVGGGPGPRNTLEEAWAEAQMTDWSLSHDAPA